MKHKTITQNPLLLAHKLKFVTQTISVGFLLFWIASCEQNKLEGITPYELVPHNAIAIAQINDFVELAPAFKKNTILNFWSTTTPSVKETISKTIPAKPLEGDLIVFSPQGKATFATTYIGQKRAQDTLPISHPELKVYEGVSIHQTETEIYEAEVGAIKLRSTTLLALENCIRNFKQAGNSPFDASFRKLKESLNTGSPLNLLISIESHLLSNKIVPSSPLVANKITGWVALDMEIEEPLEWDGINLFNDSLASPINWIQSLERKESELIKIAPQQMDAFFSLPVSNMAQLEINFRRYSQLKNMPIQQVDLRDISLVDELGWVDYKDNFALLMHLNSLENEFPLFQEQENTKTYRGVRYFNTKLPETIAKLSQSFVPSKALTWGALIDGYAVFAETESLLKHIVSNYRDNRVLANDVAYQDIEDAFSSKGSFQWIASTSTFFKSDQFPSKKYPLVGLQGVGESDFSHLHFRFGSNTLKEQKGGVSNTANFNLDSPIALGPQWLKNHRTKGMDIAVQDSNNTLYLVSSQGNLYWKKQLGEAIIGPIQQVDLYKNKKWQMAFRTQNYLYVLDRNGKEVKPFKIKLPQSEEALPLAIFDYDNNRNYRFVLAQDKRLLMYDNKGKRVKGFTRTKLQAPLITAPKHVRIKKKDYILLQRKNGTLGILNRLGKDRISVKQKINFSGAPLYLYLDTFTTTDLEGNLVQVDTKGNSIKSPYELKAGHQIDATAKSLVTLSDNNLNIKGIPVTLPFGNYTQPKIYYLNNTLYITTTDTDSQKVYLYYSNGTPVSNFPVYGISPADVSLTTKKQVQLVVEAENNGLLIYQVSH